MQNEHVPLLDVQDLSVTFTQYDGGLGQRELRVISNLALRVNLGEIVAVAGASGSGKSLLAHAVLGLLPPNATTEGTLLYRGALLDAAAQRRLRGSNIALVPQSVTYLDPLMPLGKQAQGAGKSLEKAIRQREVFGRLGLSSQTEKLYPFQLSGGMARRVLFSTAIIAGAELIIADEPTPGMHLEQALEALAILRELADAGKGVLLITHDIDLALGVADRIVVFYAGTTVEEALVADFIAGPGALRHPYSQALWRALPQNGFVPIGGFQPYAGALPPGCLFAPRCPGKTGSCTAQNPPMRELRGGMVRCHHAT